MGTRYYRPGSQRARQVRALFSSIASRYDWINDVQSFGCHRYWKKRLLQAARLQPDESALDVCCGTGDIALAMGRAGARVTAVDFTLPMLQVAQQRAGSEPGGLRLLAGNAMQLPFLDESFGVITIGYGLRNLSDFRAALREFRRVAKPGGRLLILDFGKPRYRLWRALYFAYLRVVVPLLGSLFCGDSAAYAYILESLRHYPDQAGIRDLLEETGWGNVEVVEFAGGVMSLHRAVNPYSEE